MNTRQQATERSNRMGFPLATVSLPGWVEEALSNPDREYSTEEDRMRLVIELSRSNVDHDTGGPFGAGIFDLSTNRLIAPGVNLVATTNLSAAHAEMVAIMISQQVVGHFDLGGEGLPPYELVASTEPCAMCFGAIPWSGVRRLVCGARGGRAPHRVRRGTEDIRLGSGAGAARHLRGKGCVSRRSGGHTPILRRERRHCLQRPPGRLNE